MLDIVLVSPMEFSLNDKKLFREISIKSDIENLRMNPVNNIYVRRNRENLGIEILASYLRKYNYKVGIVNAHTLKKSFSEMIAEIIAVKAKIIGISLLYDLHVFNACLIVKRLRKEGYQGHITFGGPFITLAYECFLASIPEIDSIIRGEGEIPLLELTKTILSNKDWKGIHGLAFKKGDSIIVNPPAKVLEDLSQVPIPARDTLQILKSKGIHMRIATFQASRGCNGKCTYCTAPSSTNLSKAYKWRHRSVEDIVDEIEYLVRKFKIEFLYFCDYNFFGYGNNINDWLAKLAKEICDRNIKIKFHATIRADAKLDKNVLNALKLAGLHYILLGIESGSQSALNRWNKRTTITQNKVAISIIKELGFELDPGIIMVDAYTTVEEFRNTVDFIEETGIHECFFPMYLFNQMIVFPGSELEGQLVKDGIVVRPDPWEIYDSLHEPMRLLEFCKKVSSRPYLIKDKIIREMWGALIVYTNNVTSLVDEEIPTFLNHWRIKLQTIHISKEHLIREKKVYLDFVVKLKSWRRNIGSLALDIMKTSVKWAEEKEIKPYLTVAGLNCRLREVIARYDNEWFEENIRTHINKHKKRLDSIS